MNARDARLEELRRLCQRQRNEFIAASAAAAARLPGTRQITRWLRFARRVLRLIHPGPAT